MTIEKTTENGKLTVKVAGSLDITTSPELQEELEKSYDDVNELIIDFSDLDYISSAGLRVLVSAHKKMFKKGGMKVVGANETVMDVFDVTGLIDSIDVEAAKS